MPWSRIRSGLYQLAEWSGERRWVSIFVAPYVDTQVAQRIITAQYPFLTHFQWRVTALPGTDAVWGARLNGLGLVFATAHAA